MDLIREGSDNLDCGHPIGRLAILIFRALPLLPYRLELAVLQLQQE